MKSNGSVPASPETTYKPNLAKAANCGSRSKSVMNDMIFRLLSPMHNNRTGR